MKPYPYIAFDKQASGPCDCCNEPAERTVGIRYDHSRGTDEKFELCQGHYPLALTLNTGELQRLASTKRARRAEPRKRRARATR